MYFLPGHRSIWYLMLSLEVASVAHLEVEKSVSALNDIIWRQELNKMLVDIERPPAFCWWTVWTGRTCQVPCVFLVFPGHVAELTNVIMHYEYKISSLPLSSNYRIRKGFV